MEQNQLADVIDLNVNDIVEDNLEYAKRLACRFYSKRSHSQAEMDDIISSAYLGLCQAGARYKTEKGNHFHSYSYFRIVGSMYEYLQSNGGFSRLEYKRLAGDDYEKKKERLYLAETLPQLSHVKSQIEEAGISVNINSENNTVEISYTDQELQDYTYYRKQVVWKLRIALEELSEEMQKIIVGKYFEGKSLTEIAAEFPAMTKSRISRLHGRALLILRARLGELL